MAGKAHPDKVKVTYGEWKTVREEILIMANREGITEPEMIRKIHIEAANRSRKARGVKTPLLVDYKSGNGGGLRSLPRSR